MSDTYQVPIATNRSATGIPTGRLAIWWVVASEIVIFGGLLVCFLLLRLRHPEWAAEAEHTKLAAGAFNTFVLLTSSYFVVLAHKSITDGRNLDAVKYIWWTIGGGLVSLFSAKLGVAAPAFRLAFLSVGVITLLSALVFRRLDADLINPKSVKRATAQAR